jgi:hypothetical protein
MIYTAVLTIHSWLRWLALLLGVAATVNASRDRLMVSDRPPGARWDTFFMLAVDLQVLFGLFLYFGLSPFTKAAMEDLGGALRNPALRFWGVEHIALMMAVVVLVRVGRVMALNAKTPSVRRSRRFLCFAAATTVMILGIPWPGLANGRPLFRI